MDSGKIPASVWQEEGNSEIVKRCSMQKYPTSFLSCVMENLLIFNIGEI